MYYFAREYCIIARYCLVYIGSYSKSLIPYYISLGRT